MMMSNEKDVAVKHDQPIAAINPMQMVQMAVEQGADIDKLEKLMALQERWEANEARKAYFAAMADFKKNAPPLVKNAHVSYGTTNYDHATLDEVAGKIAAAMSPLGLSFKWATDQGDGGTIKVACVISHVMGHSESTPLQASADQSGGKNNIQAIGSTVSYLQRYTLLAATGLAVSGQDNDAAAPPQYITDEQINTIIDMILHTKSNEPKLLQFVKAQSIESMTVEQFDKAMGALRAKQAEQEKA